MGLFTKKSANKPVKEGAIASFATSKRFPVNKVLASLDEFDLGLESTAISSDWAVVQADNPQVEAHASGVLLETKDLADLDEAPYQPMSQSDWVRSLNRVQESPFEASAQENGHHETTSREHAETDSDAADSCDPLAHWDDPAYTELNTVTDEEPPGASPLGDGDYTDDDIAVMMPHAEAPIESRSPEDEQRQTLNYLSQPSISESGNELEPAPGVPGPTLANEIDEESFWDMMSDQPSNWHADSTPDPDTSETSAVVAEETPSEHADSFEPWAMGQLTESEPTQSEPAYSAEYSMESLIEATSTSDTANAALVETLQGELDRDAWAELAAPEPEPEISTPQVETEPSEASKDFGQRIRLLMERANQHDTWVPSPEAVASALAPPAPPPITIPLSQTLMAAGTVLIPTHVSTLPTTAAMVIPFMTLPAPRVTPESSSVADSIPVDPIAQTPMPTADQALDAEPDWQTPETTPHALEDSHPYVATLPLETRQSLADEGILVLAGEQIAPDLQVLLVTYEGITALMADNGENAILLKTFEANPLGDAEGQALGFHVYQQAVTGNRVLFTVQAGGWQGVITLDSDEVALQLEY